jgi:hypothetical protein
MKLFFTIVILFSTPVISLFSQNATDSGMIKWDFSLTTGGIIGGPCNPMRESLLHYGIDNELEVETMNYLPIVFEAAWGIRKYLRLSLNMNILHQEMGKIKINFNTIVINPLISYNYRNFISIGLGPALNAISYSHPTFSMVNEGRDFIKPGLIVKSSLEYPKSTKAYLRIDMQFNYGATIDPFYTIIGVGISQTASRSVRLDPFPVNYFYAGIGAGLRLYRKVK